MASIISRQNGTKYIQATINKRRCSVWLGEVSQRNAERFRDKIEELVKVRSLGLPIPCPPRRMGSSRSAFGERRP